MAQPNKLTTDLQDVLNASGNNVVDDAVHDRIVELCWIIEHLRRRVDKQQGRIEKLERLAGEV